MALATLAAYQLLRPIARTLMLWLIKAYLSRSVVEQSGWVSELEAARKSWWPTEIHAPIDAGQRPAFGGSALVGSLPVFMRLLQDQLRSVVAQPFDSPAIYAFVSREAGASNAGDVVAFDALRREDQAKAMALLGPATSPPSRKDDRAVEGFAVALAAAQEAVQDGVDNFLNRLQARLETIEAIVSIGLIIGTAIILTLWGAAYVGAGWGAALFIGFCAALLAAFVRDLAIAVIRRR